MNVLRDEARALGIDLNDEQLSLFQLYYEILLDWNRRVNLTRITAPREVAIQHFLDSLTCLLVLPRPVLSRPFRLIDVGSGAGFPAVPLKIVLPDLKVTLLDSVGKKTAFLEHLTRTLRLEDVQVIHARAEDLAHHPAHREAYDIAVARAVAQLATLVEYCLPFVHPSGRFIAEKTAGIDHELQAAHAAIRILGGRLAETRTIALPGLSTPRLLVAIDKISPGPALYPRKAGLPAKNPLGAA